MNDNVLIVSLFTIATIGLIVLSYLDKVYPTNYVPGDRVVLQTTQGCGACEEAKSILNSHKIKFTEDRSRVHGLFPELIVNGKQFCSGWTCYGTSPVIKYVNEK